jgi:hypothetical protein
MKTKATKTKKKRGRPAKKKLGRPRKSKPVTFGQHSKGHKEPIEDDDDMLYTVEKDAIPVQGKSHIRYQKSVDSAARLQPNQAFFVPKDDIEGVSPAYFGTSLRRKLKQDSRTKNKKFTCYKVLHPKKEGEILGVRVYCLDR